MPPTPIKIGDEVWTWCSHCYERTTHLWDGHKLTCKECERKQAKAAEVQSEARKEVSNA